MSDTQPIPGLIQLVSGNAVINAGLSDVDDYEHSRHVIKDFCDECEKISFQPVFNLVKDPDGGFSPAAADRLKTATDELRKDGFLHHGTFYGMVRPCPACRAAHESRIA